MKNSRLKTTNIPNTKLNKNNSSNIKDNKFFTERRINMNTVKFTKAKNKVTQLLLVIITLVISQIFISGCGDSDITGVGSGNSNTLSGAGQNPSEIQPGEYNILLSMNLIYKKNSISVSRLLESNIGYRFPNIVTIDMKLKPGEEIDLQQLQPYGIFSLYLSGTGSFSLTNSDGMNLGTKTILLEKCSFIDLKLVNTEQREIQVSGFVAGE